MNLWPPIVRRDFMKESSLLPYAKFKFICPKIEIEILLLECLNSPMSRIIFQDTFEKSVLFVEIKLQRVYTIIKSFGV